MSRVPTAQPIPQTTTTTTAPAFPAAGPTPNRNPTAPYNDPANPTHRPTHDPANPTSRSTNDPLNPASTARPGAHHPNDPEHNAFDGHGRRNKKRSKKWLWLSLLGLLLQAAILFCALWFPLTSKIKKLGNRVEALEDEATPAEHQDERWYRKCVNKGPFNQPTQAWLDIETTEYMKQHQIEELHWVIDDETPDCTLARSFIDPDNYEDPITPNAAPPANGLERRREQHDPQTPTTSLKKPDHPIPRDAQEIFGDYHGQTKDKKWKIALYGRKADSKVTEQELGDLDTKLRGILRREDKINKEYHEKGYSWEGYNARDKIFADKLGKEELHEWDTTGSALTDSERSRIAGRYVLGYPPVVVNVDFEDDNSLNQTAQDDGFDLRGLVSITDNSGEILLKRQISEDTTNVRDISTGVSLHHVARDTFFGFVGILGEHVNGTEFQHVGDWAFYKFPGLHQEDEDEEEEDQTPISSFQRLNHFLPGGGEQDSFLLFLREDYAKEQWRHQQLNSRNTKQTFSEWLASNSGSGAAVDNPEYNSVHRIMADTFGSADYVLINAPADSVADEEQPTQTTAVPNVKQEVPLEEEEEENKEWEPVTPINGHFPQEPLPNDSEPKEEPTTVVVE